jgi:hypothetical protein
MMLGWTIRGPKATGCNGPAHRWKKSCNLGALKTNMDVEEETLSLLRHRAIKTS